MDNELFELCKEVYEKTGWDSTEKCYAYIDEFSPGKRYWQVIPLHEDNISDVDEWHPLYTSDYLLEKLPRYIRNDCPFSLKQLSGHTDGNWCALYSDDFEGDGVLLNVSQFADTPRKALLKLALALNEAKALTI